MKKKTISITHDRLFQIHGSIMKMRDIPAKVSFSYALAKNARMIEKHMEDVRSISKPSREMEKFEQDRIALNTEYAQKDAGGHPRIVDNTYIIDTNRMDKFNEEIEALRSHYADALANHQVMVERINELLKTELEVSIVEIKLSDIPDTLTAAQINSIMELIHEEEE